MIYRLSYSLVELAMRKGDYNETALEYGVKSCHSVKKDNPHADALPSLRQLELYNLRFQVWRKVLLNRETYGTDLSRARTTFNSPRRAK